MRTTETNTIIADTAHSYGLVDKQGRAVGCIINTCIATFVEAPADYRYGTSSKPAGVYFAFRPQATRDGKRFGPWQTTRYFNTAEERETAIAIYLRKAKKYNSKR